MSAKTSIQWTATVQPDGTVTPGATWTAVPGWPGFYVTHDGQIRGPSGNVLRPMTGHRGHLYVTRGRRSKKLYVHCAVLLSFVGSPQSGEQGRHLNGQPDDNRVGNLAWGTAYDQRDDDRRNGVDRGATRRLALEDAAAIRVSPQPSRQIARRYGVSHTAIQKIRRGERYV